MDHHEASRAKEDPVLMLEVHLNYRDGAFQLGPIHMFWPNGARIWVQGPNGAGKTTLFRLMAGIGNTLLAYGTIRLGEHDMLRSSARQCARLVAYVGSPPPAEASLWVQDVVHCGAYAHETRPSLQVLESALAKLDARALMGRLWGTLSQGEQARVWIARALVQDPQVFLFDEALSALDLPSRERILHILNQLAEEGRIIGLIEHGRGEAQMSPQLVDYRRVRLWRGQLDAR